MTPLGRSLSGTSHDLVLGLAVVALYGDAVSYGYIWDDHLLAEIDLADAVRYSLFGIHVRPVWFLSHVLSSTAFRSPVFDHAINLLLFAASAALARRVAHLFLGRASAALVVALTWVVLPWNAYPVTWISQRNDLLIFVFGFSAILALYRERYVAAFVLLALAVFSKPTVGFIPVFFIWKLRARRRHRLAVASLLLLVTYWALAVRAYFLYFTPAEHVAALPAGLRLLLFPLHWIEHFLTLAFPIPFLVGMPQAGLYLIGLAGLLFTGLGRGATAPRGEGSPERDVLALALLASIPTALTPELRICGFESLFWLILIAGRLRFRGKALAAAFHLALLASYVMGLVPAKATFDTALDEPGVHDREALYPNGYYAARRQFLIGLAQRYDLADGTGSTDRASPSSEP